MNKVLSTYISRFSCLGVGTKEYNCSNQHCCNLLFMEMRWSMCQIPKLWFTFGEPDKNCTSCLVSGPPSSLVRSFPETIIITDWDPYFSLLAWKQNKCVCTKFHKISVQTQPWKSHKRRRAVQKEICCNKYRLSRQCIAMFWFSVWEGTKISA